MLSSLNLSESASTKHQQVTVSRTQTNITTRAASFILDVNSAIDHVQCDDDVILSQIIQQLDVRAGAHCGQALLGVMGSQLRLTYTALGDVVNTASRIEQATRKLHVKALVSETMAQILQKHFLIREAGSVLAKGKTQELKVFQLGQAKDAPLFRQYEECQILARHGKCDAAITSLERALTQWPEDVIIKNLYSELVQSSGLILPPLKWTQ